MERKGYILSNVKYAEWSSTILTHALSIKVCHSPIHETGDLRNTPPLIAASDSLVTVSVEL